MPSERQPQPMQPVRSSRRAVSWRMRSSSRDHQWRDRRSQSARVGVREIEDEQAAVEIAGELGLAQARAGLERRAFGWFGVSRDTFAWQARVALAQMAHPRAVQSILDDLKGWTWETRTMAAAAAGAAGLRVARARLLAMLGDESVANPDTVRDALRQIDATPDES